jgi:phage shock protein A
MEKQVWARKRTELEKVMQKRTRMAKVASSACLLTREENKEFEDALVASEATLKECAAGYEEEQNRVDEIYTELEGQVQKLHDQTSQCNELERYA